MLLAFAISVQLLVQRSNVDFAVGRAQDFLAVGDVHRLHHVHWRGEGDVNFGLFFTLWDRLLGTYENEPAREPAAGDIGVRDFPHFPRNYVAQVLLPFRDEEAANATATEPGAPASPRPRCRAASPRAWCGRTPARLPATESTALAPGFLSVP